MYGGGRGAQPGEFAVLVVDPQIGLMIQSEHVGQHAIVRAEAGIAEAILGIQMLVRSAEFCFPKRDLKAGLRSEYSLKCLGNALILSNAATRNEPGVFCRLVVSPSHQDRAHGIADNQINRYKGRVPDDIDEF